MSVVKSFYLKVFCVFSCGTENYFRADRAVSTLFLYCLCAFVVIFDFFIYYLFALNLHKKQITKVRRKWRLVYSVFYQYTGGSVYSELSRFIYLVSYSVEVVRMFNFKAMMTVGDTLISSGSIMCI